jgi:5-methylcytosine-specific restriction endonuclease McrA
MLDGCEKPSRNKGGGALCKMHYHRQYRHGSTDKAAHLSDVTASLGRRYTSTYKPGHPLASKHGKVYTHRLVLFEAIGYGPHVCHWCETEIDWLPKGDPQELQPDHLNGDGADNRIENLVTSCRSCNTARGCQARAAALRAAGWWSNNDTIAALANGGRSAPVESRKSA